ncbi:mitochondrial import inner membrane translocase subunit Tim8 [Daktulosphaira vitifoliae]|uniref:mitochondrial import inner membrane translocase subunit Tim8 n=1 Tax=Daktulosphaira vitifoliae TaxID=58002 RepID=UPI0021A9B2E9|nr:mitochondrial import inner membrane translocase subunit Tim8 [Daktulosphaira vitifoliae]
MSDLFGNNDNFDMPSDVSDKAKVEEIQKIIMMEQQKAQLNAQIQEISEICWEKCVDKPSAKLGGKAEICISNCVKRFFDTSVVIATRFNQLLQRSNSG